MSSTQSATNHTRWLPPFHFVALPILLVNAVVALVVLVRGPSLGTTWGFLVATAIFLAVLLSRSQTVTVQDRLIRLEERLRMQRVLLPSQHDDIGRLERQHFVALRFASDEELPDLVRRTVKGDFATPKDIKSAIRGWQPDHLRA